MSLVQDNNAPWLSCHQENQLSYTPLPRLDVIEDNAPITPPTYVNQVPRMLMMNDDDDDEEEEEDHITPTPSRTSSTEYIKSVRKTRPLPQIPQRSTSKELPKNMTEVLHDSFKDQNKLTAQQLFQIMCDNRANAFQQQDESDEEDDDYYDGMYALKTQVPSPEVAKRILAQTYHEQFNSHAYKMMTPVQEVEEEDQLYAEYQFQQESDTSSPNLTHDASSFSSKSASIESHLEEDGDPTNQPQFHLPLQHEEEEPSLIHDVQRLTLLNQALLTPNSTLSSMPSSTDTSLSDDMSPIDHMMTSNEYSHVNTTTPQAMTSVSLTHDKESIKTYRRMATKTHNKNIQFTYATYLLQLVSFYNANDMISKNSNTTKERLQEEAEYWIEKLAKNYHADALFIKGQWHSRRYQSVVGSQYRKVNHTKAYKCFQQAAKYGSTEAYYELAEYYSIRKEYKKAMQSYRYAASKNHILSLYKLSNILLRGLLKQEQDIHQGLIFLKIAADVNKPESARSAYDLACIYSHDFESIGMDSANFIGSCISHQMTGQAVKYYKKASDLGMPTATFRLGNIYEGGHLGTEIDVWKAYKLYVKAAELNHEGAMLELSRLYKDGIPDYLGAHPDMAFKWCKKAAENGNEIAAYTMGVYYDQGIGVLINHTLALEWFQKSALKGYPPAKTRLNQMSYMTDLVKPHIEKKIDVSSNQENKKYYEESVRIAEKSRRSHTDQNCPVM